MNSCLFVGKLYMVKCLLQLMFTYVTDKDTKSIIVQQQIILDYAVYHIPLLLWWIPWNPFANYFLLEAMYHLKCSYRTQHTITIWFWQLILASCHLNLAQNKTMAQGTYQHRMKTQYTGWSRMTRNMKLSFLWDMLVYFFYQPEYSL